jgi:hypothetical protein
MECFVQTIARGAPGTRSAGRTGSKTRLEENKIPYGNANFQKQKIGTLIKPESLQNSKKFFRGFDVKVDTTLARG